MKDLMKDLTRRTSTGDIQWGYSRIGDYYFFILDKDRVELRTEGGDLSNFYILYKGSEKHYKGWYAGRKLNKAIEQQRQGKVVDLLELESIRKSADRVKSIDELSNVKLC